MLIQIFKLVSGLRAVAAMPKVKIQTKHCKLYLRARFKLMVSRYTLDKFSRDLNNHEINLLPHLRIPFSEQKLLNNHVYFSKCNLKFSYLQNIRQLLLFQPHFPLLLDHSIKMRFLDRDINNTVILKVHSDRFGLDKLRIFQLETCDWGL